LTVQAVDATTAAFGLDFFSRLDEPGRVLQLIDRQMDARVRNAARGMGVEAPPPASAGPGFGEWDGVTEGEGDEAAPGGGGDETVAEDTEAAAGTGDAAAAASRAREAAASEPMASLRTFLGKHRALHAALLGLVDEFGLVGFRPLNIMDKDSVISVTRAVDKANGYTFGALHDGSDSALGAQGADWAPRPGVGGLMTDSGEEAGVRGVVASDESRADARAAEVAAARYLGAGLAFS